MAFTIGTIDSTVFGNLRVKILSCSVDSASGNIVTGLNVVHGYALGPVSMTSMGFEIKRNTGSGATAINGTINVNSMTTGDVFFLTVFGT